MNHPVAAVALAAMMVAGCASSTGSTEVNHPFGSPAASAPAAVPQAATPGSEVPIGAVPWSQVGAGWTLATWSPVPGGKISAGPTPGAPTPATATTTLYLVDPTGVRYPITTFGPPGENNQGPELVDWSADGTRAMFLDGRPDGEGSTVITVDLRSGTQTSFGIDGYEINARFTRPEGTSVLVVKKNDRNGPASFERVDLVGKHQLTYPVEQFGSEFYTTYEATPYLSTTDGTQLVIGTESGLALMGNDGTLGEALPVAGEPDCQPTRWWDSAATIVLASCADYDAAARYSQLWLVPIDGTAPTALTAPNDGQKGPDYGALTAWQLPTGTFVQTSGPCGLVSLAKLNADGTTSPVSVPNVDANSSVVVVGVNGDDLTVQATVSCGTGESLLNYDPAAGTSTVLLGPPVNDGGVIHVLPYPGQE